MTAYEPELWPEPIFAAIVLALSMLVGAVWLTLAAGGGRFWVFVRTLTAHAVAVHNPWTPLAEIRR